MKFFVWGVLAMGSLVPALFFLRYWRSSRDRLFAFFAVAFGLMALSHEEQRAPQKLDLSRLKRGIV